MNPTYGDMHSDLDHCDLSSLVALRALAASTASGEWLPLSHLAYRVHEGYATLGLDPEVGMGLVLPPWEVTARPTPEAEEYVRTHVVPLLASRGLVEVGEDAVRLSPAVLAATFDLGEEAEARIRGLVVPPAPAAAPVVVAAPRAPGETLSASSLVKVYRRRRVVNDVGLRVSQGEIVGLLGPNGAGKTTTFYMMVGLIAPDSGRVSIGKEDVTEVPMYRRARKGIGYLAQEPSIFRKLTVEQNVLAILQMLRLSKKEQAQRLEELLDELGIKHLRHSKAYALSGGERRRLEITRALVGQPKFMLLDEPFAGVDPIAVHDIQQIVTDLRRRNIGVLISDHNVEQTLDIVDRAYIMYDGKVRVSGTVSELVWNDEVAEIYLGPTLTARMRQRYTYPE
jgi:lipopolysaccharide export system ATP-binding protein